MDSNLETLATQPATPYVIWGEFTFVVFIGILCLLVFVRVEKPKSWLIKKMHSAGKQYLEESRLKLAFILFSLIAFSYSLTLGIVFSYISVGIFMTNVLFLLNFSVAKETQEQDKEINYYFPKTAETTFESESE